MNTKADNKTTYSEDVARCYSTTELANWEPSTCNCPNCGGNNTMINTMIVLTSYPEQYQFKCRDCGHRWTEHKHISVPPMKTWPNLEKEMPKYNGSYGWICPKCGSTYAPGTTECPRCAAPYKSVITCGQPLTVATGTVDVVDWNGLTSATSEESNVSV